MTLTVFVEQLDEHTYRAETSQPIALSAQGGSREEALSQLRALAERKMASGDFVRLEVGGLESASPWSRFAGVWKDHPELEEFRQNVAEYRRQIDEEEPASA